MDDKDSEDQSLVSHPEDGRVINRDDAADDFHTLGGSCGRVTFFQIKLNKGITPKNIIFYWIAVIATISCFVYINAVSGYVLTNFLNIPQDNQGMHMSCDKLLFDLVFTLAEDCMARHSPNFNWFSISLFSLGIQNPHTFA
jgi:uncharacterized membrane protein YoaK (UPF0700 family)